MRDKYFFPLAVLLTVMMVFLAIQPGIGRLPEGAVAGDGVNYDRIEISGPYLNKAISGGDARVQLVRDERTYYLYIEAEVDALAASPELGPHFRLAPDIEAQFAGHRIRVTARVRPADTRGAEQVELNYSTGRAGDSGWQSLNLQPGFSDISFEYDVPPLLGEQGVDYIAFRPLVPEKSRALILERIVLERLRATDATGS